MEGGGSRVQSERFLEGIGWVETGEGALRQSGGTAPWCFEGEASGRVCSAHTGEIVIRPMRSLMILCSLWMLGRALLGRGDGEG